VRSTSHHGQVTENTDPPRSAQRPGGAAGLSAAFLGFAALCFAVLIVLNGHVVYWLAFAANLVAAILQTRTWYRTRR
jgi:hypothetical protein